MSRRKRKSNPSYEEDEIRQVKITVAESDPDENPIVISFPGGLPESIINKDHEHVVVSQVPKFSWQKLDDRSRFGRRVVGYDKHIVYSGSAEGLGFDDRKTKVCVGVYNKKLGTLTLHEAATRGTVFAMGQTVPAYNQLNGHIETKKGIRASQPNVFEDFGSSKKKKVLKSNAANRVEIDNVVGAGSSSAMVHHIMEGHSMSESNRQAIEGSRQSGTDRKSATQTALEEARKQLLPAYDEDAVRPELVYDARQIAGEKAWNRVYRKVEACLHKDDPIEEVIDSIPESRWNSFAKQFIRNTKPRSDNVTFRITCSLLANWMVEFYKNNGSRKVIEGVDETKSTYFGIPSEVAGRCIDLFTTPLGEGTKKKKNFVMSKQNKEKALIHILLLQMLASGPSMKLSPINPIADALKVPVKDCTQILKYAGCTVTKKGDSYSANLTTPVNFPVMSRGRPAR